MNLKGIRIIFELIKIKILTSLSKIAARIVHLSRLRQKYAVCNSLSVQISIAVFHLIISDGMKIHKREIFK